MLCRIVDVGARYGVFPLFSDILEVADYHMFEIDIKEAQRLERKYISRPNITVHKYGLYSENKEKELYISAHRGLSSLYKVNHSEVYSKNHFFEEIKQEEVIKVDVKMLDKVLENVHYLKIDTEGSELEVLKGAKELLKESIVGIRAEVNFTKIRDNVALFDEINSFLRVAGFDLVNFDYNGKGTPQSKLIDPERFGLLISTDATWVKNDDVFNIQGEKGLILKALFLMLNKAEDVAIALLEKNIKMKRLSLKKYCNNELVKTLDKLMLKHLKKLSSTAYFSYKELDDIYFLFFGKNFKKWHLYYESL